MRVPDKGKLFKQNVYGEGEYENKIIRPYIPAARNIYNLDVPMERDKFIKRKIEPCVRQSYEYSVLINFLRNTKNMRRCAFLPNLVGSGISIEIHHTPFSLYDISAIVTAKHMVDYGTEINFLEICEEIVQLHYEGVIGLIPLSKTVHELTHNGFCFIPINFVYGGEGVLKFYEEYEQYMTSDQKLLFQLNSKTSDILEKPPEILKRKFMYLDYVEQDAFRFPSLNTLEEILGYEIPIPA